MIIGLLKVHIHLSGISSLKDKRKIVKSLIERLKSRFNLSVAEVDRQDRKSHAVIGISFVSNGSNFVQQQLEAVINFIRADARFYVGEIQREIFPEHFA